MSCMYNVLTVHCGFMNTIVCVHYCHIVCHVIPPLNKESIQVRDYTRESTWRLVGAVPGNSYSSHQV